MKGGTLMWINKTAGSSSLSHSENDERIQIFGHAQRTSRPRRVRASRRSLKPGAKQVLENDAVAVGDRLIAHSFRRPDVVVSAVISAAPRVCPRIRRAVSFFLHSTVHKIIFVQRDHDFWLQTVPYMAEENAVVRHLVAAIAATHEFLDHGRAQATDIFALQECNKAISLLRGTSQPSTSLLLVSCILTAAFNLLRCDMAGTNATVESGLKLADDLVGWDGDEDAAETSGDSRHRLSMILAQLKYRHGYKLWTADIAFRFEQIDDCQEAMIIETEWIQAPLLEVADVARGYRDLMIHIMAKLARNLARGAYIDPQCSLAQRTTEQLNLLSTYARAVYESLSVDQEKEKVDLEQMRIGINHAVLLFHTKLANPVERFFDEWDYGLCQETLSLGNQVLEAQRRGFSVCYLDRIVNGALFAVGLCCKSFDLQQQAISLLEQQASQKDGFLHWLRAAVLKAISAVQAHFFSCRTPALLSTRTRVWLIIVDVTYSHATGTLVVEYTPSHRDTQTYTFNHHVDWTTAPHGTFVESEICPILNGIISSYKMYSKPRPSEALLGYLREMQHDGSRVPVFWETATQDTSIAE